MRYAKKIDANQLLSPELQEEALTMLDELSEKLCEWHGECDAYCVREMKKYELIIDAFIEKAGR